MNALDNSARSRSGRDGEMEVLCACDERYLPHVATMLCSLLEHNGGCRIHLFYSTIAGTELAKLKSLVSRYESEIILYEVVPADIEDLRIDKWASIAVYYRLLAPRLLPKDISKVLYLDADIVVRRSLTQLWNTDLTNYALAAVSSFDLPPGTKYFNSGVLLINLQFWRQNDVPERAIAFARNNPDKMQYWDQDALNAILVGRWFELPLWWNWHDWVHTSLPGTKLEPAIVHFIGGGKPWHWSNSHPFKGEYHRYRLKTPWRTYRLEGKPCLRQRVVGFLRVCGRMLLPGSLRRWLRSRMTT
jgi:lipopolysaccharide biosynthesis glycosyltransferase